MRIDEIDLIGLVKVLGATSGSGQVISYTETGLNWATASSVASTSTIKKSGYNYIIVETVNTGNDAVDAITNGDALVTAYAQAKLDIIGTLSATNRFTIILMPGSYDLYNNSYLDLDTSFIDIVGLSSNPGSVYLYHSSTSQVFNYHQDVDSRLENVKMGGFVVINNGVDTGQYLRWKNLIFTGGDPFNGLWNNINGEFENIKCVGVGFAYNVPTSINGIYKNIESTGNSFTMVSSGTPTLTGTFSNIKINQVFGFAFYNIYGNITGYFEDISISLDAGNAGAQEVFRSLDINGTFKNIKVVNDVAINTFFDSFGGSIFGTYKDIGLASSSAISTFSSTGPTMSGIFEDIYLPTSLYAFQTNQDMVGTFSNITVGDVTTGGFFNTSNVVNGYFDNIKVGICANNVFTSTTINGKFKDIEIGGVSSNVDILSGSNLLGTYENIVIKSFTANSQKIFKGSTQINATFKNIEINSSGTNGFFYSDGTINANLDGLVLNGTSTDSLFESFGTITGIYKNIECGDILQMFTIFGTGDINATFENITTNDAGTMFFTGDGNLNNNLKNINVNTVDGFMTTVGIIYITGEDIYIKNTGNAFNGSSGIVANLKNVRFSNITLDSGPPSMFYSVSSLYGEYENIVIDIVSSSGGSCFRSDGGSMTLELKNVEIPNGFDRVLYQSNKTLQGNVTMKNVTIGECTTSALDINFSAVTFAQNVVSPNIMSINTIMRGEWIDCDLDQYKNGEGIGSDFILSGAIVRNSKLLGRVNGPPDYGVSGSGQVTHTILYFDLDFTSGSFPLTPNYNVTNYA